MKDTEKNPGIAVGQVFLEGATFAHRADALSLPEGTKPELGDLDVGLQVGLRSDGKGGLLRVNVSTRKDANAVYEVSLSMVGLFEEQAGSENMSIEEFVRGPAIPFMFPFVREAFANLTGRGRFGPVFMNPFNTTAVMAAMARERADSPAKAASPSETPPPKR